MNKLGLHVATKYEGSVQNVERNKFKKEIYDGKRISINSLQKLATLKKQDYFESIIAYDERV